MSTRTSEGGSEAIAEVHRRIGRNLLRFQEMEASLKLILPYIHPDASTQGIEAMQKYRKEHVDQMTLGHLMSQFTEATRGHQEFFAQSEKLIVAARNDLVHHFYRLPEVDLLHENGLKQALDWLERQFNECQEWHQFLRTKSLIILLTLIELNPQLAAQYGAHHERLLAQLPPGLEYIDKCDSIRTNWASTRIVRLLQQAEHQTEKRNGYTLLARAGKFIKERAPDVSPEEYGVRTLRDILVSSGMFEVGVEADQSTIVYRSLAGIPIEATEQAQNHWQWTLTREK